MLFDGRKRMHHWDRINAQVAAEKLADYLTKANYVVMRVRQPRRTPPRRTTGETWTRRRGWPAAAFFLVCAIAQRHQEPEGDPDAQTGNLPLLPGIFPDQMAPVVLGERLRQRYRPLSPASRS